MQALTRNSLDVLRGSLPLFSEVGGVVPGLALFCDYYGLDFDRRLPGVSHRVGVVPSGGYQLAVHSWQVPAQSTGCAAVVEFARRFRSWPFTGTVLLAPLLRPAYWWRVRAAYTVLSRFIGTVPRAFVENSTDRVFLEFVRNDPLQPHRIPVRWVGALRCWLAGLPLQDLAVGPALLVQGDADTTVDWRYNLPHYGTLFPGLRIELIPGAGHQLANEAEPLRKRYLKTLDRYLGW